MKSLKIPVKGGLTGHVSTVPVGKDGIIWTCNTFPFGEKGVLLWRPRLQITTEHSDYETIFDPTTESLLDAECIGGAGVILIKQSSQCVLRMWTPGTAIITFSKSFPLPSDGETGQIKFVGNYLVVGIDGKGLYIVTFNSTFSSFSDMYRIGSIYYGLSGSGGECTTLTGTTTLLTISESIQAWIGTITLYLFRPDPTYEFTFNLQLTDGTTTITSDETYSSYSIATGIADIPEFPRVWTPITFTFNIAIDLSSTWSLKINKVSGSMNVYLEAASNYYVKSGYTVSTSFSDYPHLHINGSLDPDGGIVAASRGMIAGVYDGNKMQFASLVDFDFIDEVTVENNIVAADNFNEGMILLTETDVYSLTGWSHGAITLNKLAAVGVADYHNFVSVDNGMLAYSWGMVDFYSKEGVNTLDLPFLYDLDTDSYVCYIPSYKLIVIGFKDYHYSLVVSLKEKWIVWWRWDEIGEQYFPLKSYGNILVFSDGKAYVFNSHDNTSTESYKIELLVGTGFIEEDITFECLGIRANVGLFIENTDDVSLSVLSGGKYGLQKTQATLEITTSPSSSLLDDTTSIFGIGTPYQIPYQYAGVTVKPRLAYPTLPPLETVTASLGAVDSTSPGFPSGNAFLIELVLEKDIFKHPGYLLDYFEIVLEEVGNAIIG